VLSKTIFSTEFRELVENIDAVDKKKFNLDYGVK
jgi:hypothetical protein